MADPPSERDRALARLIRGTAAEFEAVFNRARPTPKPGETPIAFAALAGGNGVEVEEQIARAIAHARADGWLPLLIERIVADEELFVDRRLLETAEAQKLLRPKSTLQSLLDAGRGFVEAGLEFQRFGRAIRQVCRIDIKGKAAGTGFLVRPDVVLTAYHVVRPLTVFDQGDPADPTLQIVQCPNSAPFLRVVFDNLDILAGDFFTELAGFSVPVAENWLIGASPCHKLELNSGFPLDLSELADRYDYALIQLAGIARPGIPPVRIRATPVLAAGENIAILQHPDGRSLSLDRAKVVKLLGDVRFEHDVNSQGGSSGSPCFDRKFEVVGLHHAGTDSKEIAPGAPRPPNRAVPHTALFKVVESMPPPSLRLVPMCELTDEKPGHPVIGRLETQQWVWERLEPGGPDPVPPILIVQPGGVDGKSFTHAIMRSLLLLTEHDVLRLIAHEDIQALEPEGFARMLLERLRYPAMAVMPVDPNAENVRSQTEELLPQLLSALDAGRGGKGVWIVIDDIDKASIGGSTDISSFLYNLYSAAATRPWLHFALLGLDAVPSAIREHTRRHRLAGFSQEDVQNYVLAKLPGSLSFEERKGFADAAWFSLEAEEDVEAFQQKLATIVAMKAREKGR